MFKKNNTFRIEEIFEERERDLSREEINRVSKDNLKAKLCFPPLATLKISDCHCEFQFTNLEFSDFNLSSPFDFSFSILFLTQSNFTRLDSRTGGNSSFTNQHVFRVCSSLFTLLLTQTIH